MRLAPIIAMAIAVLWLPCSTEAQRLTPIPKPPYMILGSVAGYTNYDLDSYTYFKLPDHWEALGTEGYRVHGATYSLHGEHRSIRVEVQEVSDGTWLQHEVEDYAWVKNDRRQRPKIREVAGQNLIFIQAATGDYVWVSGGNKAVHLSWSGRPPEEHHIIEELPEDFVAAYLERLPSDLEPFEFDDARRVRWIRNEIERQFYYIDNILERLRSDPGAQMPFPGIIDRLGEIVKLAERHLGGPSVGEWLSRVWGRSIQRRQQPGEPPEPIFTMDELEAEVQALKQWWAEHRNDPIVLPTPTMGRTRTAAPTESPQTPAMDATPPVTATAAATEPRSEATPAPVAPAQPSPSRAAEPAQEEGGSWPLPLLVFTLVLIAASWIWWRYRGR